MASKHTLMVVWTDHEKHLVEFGLIYKAEVGIEGMEYPVKKYLYYAYKNEAVVAKTDMLLEAKLVSSVVEKVWVNEDEYKQALTERRDLESKAYNAWHTDLRKEHSEVPDKVFDLCYAKASDEVDDSGLDELADTLPDIVDFAKKIIKAAPTNMPIG